MKPLRIRAGRVVVCVALVLGAGAAVTSAQGAAPLQSLIGLLEQLQASVSALQQSVNALGASDNFVFTPVVRVESGIIDCNFVNVTAEPRHVEIVIVNAATGATATQDSGLVATPPGRFRSTGAFSPGGFTGMAYCKFTVLDGVKTDIRANLTLTPNVGGVETTTVSVDAY